MSIWEEGNENTADSCHPGTWAKAVTNETWKRMVNKKEIATDIK